MKLVITVKLIVAKEQLTFQGLTGGVAQRLLGCSAVMELNCELSSVNCFRPGSFRCLCLIFISTLKRVLQNCSQIVHKSK